MDPKIVSIIGRVSAFRPLLIAAIFAAGGAALAAHSVSSATASLLPNSIEFLSALCVLVLLPIIVGVLAPRKPGSHFLYALGVVIAAFGFAFIGRQSEVSELLVGIELNLWIAGSALFSLVIILGGAFWGWIALRLLVAAAASLLGVASAMAFFSVSGAVSAEAAMLIVTAMAMTSSIVVLLGSAFARCFIEGEKSLVASAQAVHVASTASFFIILLLSIFTALRALVEGQAMIDPLWLALTSATLCVMPTLMVGGGALSLRNFTEQLAVDENRRRSRFRRAMLPLRDLLPPSSAFAMAGVVLIFAIVSAFEAPHHLSFYEVSIIVLAPLLAGITFVSLRTGLLLFLILLASSLVLIWVYPTFGGNVPQADERIVALLTASVPLLMLCSAWRDARNPRRKAREVTMQALVDSAAFAILSAILTAVVYVAAAISGYATDGVIVATYFIWLFIIGLFIAPPLMTAMGALFGRT